MNCITGHLERSCRYRCRVEFFSSACFIAPKDFCKDEADRPPATFRTIEPLTPSLLFTFQKALCVLTARFHCRPFLPARLADANAYSGSFPAGPQMELRR